MKITVTKDFETAEEATRFLQGGQQVLAITAEEIDLVCEGRKIEAVKSIRSRTGAGLKEAVDLVKRLDPMRGSRAPIGPTWTSQNGTTTPLRDLPTRYVSSILRFAHKMNPYGYGAGCGLANACLDELRRRGA